MKQIIYLIKTTVPLLSIFFLFSCTNLEVESISTITNASFWKSENDVNSSVNGMYVQFRNVTTDMFFAGELRSDVFERPPGSPYTGTIMYYENTLNSSNINISWGGFYAVINTANLIIKNAPNITFTLESNKNKLMAQAYAMRAFSYYVLTRTWGDLIIHTDPVESSSPAVIYKERMSQSDVFKLVKDDIEQALRLFPDDSYPDGRCFWSRPAAYALKADVYLWTGKRMNGSDADFTVALQALQEIVKTDVTLLTEFSEVFKFDNKGNREIIISCRYDEFESSNNYFYHMWSGFVPGIDEETLNFLYPGGSGNQNIRASDNYANQYEQEDLRKNGSLLEVFGDDAEGQRIVYARVCRKGTGYVTPGNDRLFINDVILYRYADILLMIAEAKNALGQDPSSEINMIRERAFKENYGNHIYLNDSKEKNDEIILKERLLELAMEGKRWWDLIRFDKVFDLVPSLQDRKGQDYLLLFPIGLTELSREPNVKQNPGW